MQIVNVLYNTGHFSQPVPAKYFRKNVPVICDFAKKSPFCTRHYCQLHFIHVQFGKVFEEHSKGLHKWQEGFCKGPQLIPGSIFSANYAASPLSPFYRYFWIGSEHPRAPKKGPVLQRDQGAFIISSSLLETIFSLKVALERSLEWLKITGCLWTPFLWFG